MIKDPRKTTVYDKLPPSEANEILFAPELIHFILEKKKVKTYRYGDQYDYLNVGDEVVIKQNNKDTIIPIAKAKIIAKKKTTFKDLPLGDDGHETYQDKEHQRKIFSGYYKFLGREIQDDDPFLAFDFQLIDD